MTTESSRRQSPQNNQNLRTTEPQGHYFSLAQIRENKSQTAEKKRNPQMNPPTATLEKDHDIDNDSVESSESVRDQEKSARTSSRRAAEGTGFIWFIAIFAAYLFAQAMWFPPRSTAPT